MDKDCLSCGQKIAGRSDKKFCSEQCRNDYNNILNKDANNYVRTINNALRKNRRILTSLNPDGKSKVHKDKMLSNGFDFNFFTSTYTTKAGSVYTFCYEQGYLPIGNDFFALVVKREFVD